MDDNIYQAPSSSAPTSQMTPDSKEPAAIKVLGVMDLVFAGLGIVQVLMGIVMGIAQKQFQSSDAGGDYAQSDLRLRVFSEKMESMTYVSYAFTVILAVLSLRAGLALVKRRQKAVSLSNQYAWTSLFFKLIALIVSIVFAGPILSEYLENEVDQKMTQVMKFITMGAIIIGTVISAIYPAICIILLNKVRIREFLEKHGTV